MTDIRRNYFEKFFLDFHKNYHVLESFCGISEKTIDIWEVFWYNTQSHPILKFYYSVFPSAISIIFPHYAPIYKSFVKVKSIINCFTHHGIDDDSMSTKV